ncbi:hypothetical protein GCM10017579_21710 [Nocardioides luteus]|uniref:Uncharacterized protein n=1 Tax=Nocardioides luteus TaxID=1844 RepID=A0ABQ5SVT4_9ACTN|nr:hypothetical protein GCM10017579_21710 [Nocardioides luteus]
MGLVVEAGHALAPVVVAYAPDEEGHATGGVVVEGVHHLGDIERRLPDVEELDGAILRFSHGNSLVPVLAHGGLP